jgi:uncharacterized protein
MFLPTKNRIAAALLFAAMAAAVSAQVPAVGPGPVAAKAAFSQELRDAILAQRWQDARPQLETLVTAGDTTASVALGTLLVRGIDGEKNPKRGQKLLETAAERGSGPARRLLAQYFFRGDLNNGTPQYSKAWNFIYPMAQANDPMGMYLAGKIIRDGLLGSPNETVGRDMILQSAMRGWPEAQQELSGIANLNLNTESGGYDDKNEPLSTLDVLNRAAKKGNPDAFWQLGLVNLYGIGTDANPAAAKSWFEKGQAKGDAAAMVMLWYFARDIKTTPQLAIAIKKASARSALGYATIARQLATGRGGAVDLDQAAYFAMISGQLGAPDSFDIIADLKKKMTAEALAVAEQKFHQWRTENLRPQF